VRLDSVKQEDYDTVFYPGGHGPMWDLAEDKNSIRLLESFVAVGKTFAVVCHSTGALHHVRTPDGKLLVEGRTSAAQTIVLVQDNLNIHSKASLYGARRPIVQCLDRRIPDKQTHVEEVAADRNTNHAKANWHFTTPNARIELKHLYPSI
jgi:putative intracellular protease/amidase